MIVVNDPGTWRAVYPPLLHADWHGWTYTDTIFPFFLFLSGVSMSLSFARRRAEGSAGRTLLRHAAVRAGLLVAVGLALNLAGFLAFHREHFRVPGVLQRIGVCALLAAAILVAGGARAAGWSAALLLVGYWGLLGTGPLDPGANLAATVDRAVLGAHTWKPDGDPEGLLSTLPALATMLLGVLAGEKLRSPDAPAARIRALASAGAAGIALGLCWARVFPINKSLWTSSYAVLMSGMAALCLAACYWLVDVRSWKSWTAPFLWLGRNAIAAFTLSSFGAIALLAIRVAGPDGKPRSLWTAIHRSVFDRFADPRLGSLLFALAYLGLWIAVFGVLHRKRVFVKI